MSATAAGPRARDDGALRIDSAAELVEAGERVIRSIFGTGLVVALATTVALTAILAASGANAAAVGAVVLSLGVGVALSRVSWLFRTLRRFPSGLPVVGVVLGVVAAVTCRAGGDLLMMGIAVPLAILGTATPDRHVLAAALIAAGGYALATPLHDLSGADVDGRFINTAMIVVVPPLFRRLIDRLVRFALDLHRITGPAGPDGAAPPRGDRTGPDGAPPRGGRTGEGPARSLPAAGAGPATGGAPAAGAGPTTNGGEAAVPGGRLTTRQLKTVLLASHGLRHAEIAACLGITTASVRRTLDAARRRTGSRSTAHLVAWAIEEGLVPAGAPRAGGSGSGER